MNVNLRQVRAFIVTARFASFTRAANLLNLSQPALTVQIRQLEQSLGVRLFDRNTRSVELTRVGRDLLPALERLLGDFDAVVESAREMAALRSGSVSIAALPSVAATVLPPLIAEFRAAHPRIRVQIRDGVGRRINALVQEEAVDFGIGADIEPEAGLETVRLLGDELLAVLPPDHRLCAAERLTLEELAAEPLILTNPESTVRYLANRAFAERNLLIAPAYEVTYMSTAVGLVRAGLGIALLPSTAIELSLAPAIALRPVDTPALRRSIALVLKAGRSLSPAAQAFREMLTARVDAQA
ncbi:LysR family transcriptional regulator [Azospirillum sp. SYSU D00513]|uniref:LysR family transcriptional regulator n=1 Tax=Azospirillum sp. SYSU D00513 TaxID=2812561 RepID=UPI001A964C50|nr:LysR family transcriptional regulator [Azospirillum sp. SYSU D00513]